MTLIRFGLTHVRTDDRIIHAAYPVWRPLKARSARTYCGQLLRFDQDSGCDETRRFCSQVADDATIDCMTCLTAIDR